MFIGSLPPPNDRFGVHGVVKWDDVAEFIRSCPQTEEELERFNERLLGTWELVAGKSHIDSIWFEANGWARVDMSGGVASVKWNVKKARATTTVELALGLINGEMPSFEIPSPGECLRFMGGSFKRTEEGK